MKPIIKNREENLDVLTFTLENVDVCIANALRRVILSEINTVIFKTTPYSENKATIFTNTSRMNNEILKQRLSCVPIHIKDMELDSLKNYIVELNVTNDTDKIMTVTTKDFKIKNIEKNTYLTEEDVKKIFKPYIPLNSDNEYYIVLLYLRPKISNDIQGEKIHVTCEFSIGNSKEDGMFNVVSTCSYGNTVDYEKMEKELEKKIQALKDENVMTQEEIVTESKNWKLLEGLRYVKSKSFDFIIQSVGIYENTEIIIKSCEFLMDKLTHFDHMLDQDEVPIKPSDNTLENCYDVTLVNEDYTLGNILNYELYTVFYTDLKALDYVGFKKMHPHDSYSILRLSITDKTKGISTVKTMVKNALERAIKKVESIKGCFDGTRSDR